MKRALFVCFLIVASASGRDNACPGRGDYDPRLTQCRCERKDSRWNLSVIYFQDTFTELCRAYGGTYESFSRCSEMANYACGY